MPGGDGTGPVGRGPMTGRAAGYCAGYPAPGFANPSVGGRFAPARRSGAPAAYAAHRTPYRAVPQAGARPPYLGGAVGRRPYGSRPGRGRGGRGGFGRGGGRGGRGRRF